VMISESMDELVKKFVEKRGFLSKSDFVRYAIREILARDGAAEE